MATPSRLLSCPGCGAAADPEATRCGYCDARLATVACPHCFAPMFVGSRHCGQCGTRAARTDAGAARRECPHCRTAMAAVRIGALDTAECPRCDGLWLDAETFERLCASGEAQAAVLQWERGRAPTLSLREPVRYRRCPACRQFMNRMNFARISGVIIDVCRKDGVFFDRSELHQVIAFIRGGGLERSRDRKRQEMAEEERRLRAAQQGEFLRFALGPKVVFKDELPSGARLEFETLLRIFGSNG